MARKPRVLVDGGYYHIITRGNDRRNLFRYQQDYKYFLEVLIRYLAKFRVDIIHYCLMPNHVHLLIRAYKAADLPKFMQGVLQVYADYFKRKYDSVGFVFQNRYKSFLIDRDSYLLECGRYIERNPLRSGITNNLLDYPWSSFSFYARGDYSAIIKTVNPLYLDFAKRRQERRKRYYDYVLTQRPYDLIVDKALKI